MRGLSARLSADGPWHPAAGPTAELTAALPVARHLARAPVLTMLAGKGVASMVTEGFQLGDTWLVVGSQRSSA